MKLLKLVPLLFSSITINAQQQKPLLLSEAVSIGTSNYQTIQARRNYLNASSALVENARAQYLPNVIASLQQDFGTINGQYGPLGSVGAAGVASAGPVGNSQNWNAAFGALYLVNANWEVFTFGRAKAYIETASATLRKDSADLRQQEFIVGVKIASAYLNLLAAQKYIDDSQKNLQRVISVQQSVIARTKSGLNAGVDSSMVNADVSRAKLVVIDARNIEQQYQNQLAQLLNTQPVSFQLDSVFLNNIPKTFGSGIPVEENPQAKFYQARIGESDAVVASIKKSILPGVNLFGVFQTRGSGFSNDYGAGNGYKYAGGYFDGIKPSRYNYLTGVSLAWNIVSPLKIRHQVQAQQFISQAYKNEYDQTVTQLKDQLVLADQRIENTLQSAREVPIQYQAAADAYLQKSVLYKNGLTTIVDLQQALYALNRAQTDRSVAYINVWQALLLKAAASGDWELFRGQVN